MKTRRGARTAWAAAVAGLAAAGCAAITGAADLEIGLADGGALSELGDGAAPGADGPSVSQPLDDAGAADAVADADADASKVSVRCNDAECVGICCVSFSGTATCIPAGQACPSQSMALSCDERADCPAGSSCCLTFNGPQASSSCAPSCLAQGAETLCEGDAECPAPAKCIPLSELEFPPGQGKGGCN